MRGVYAHVSEAMRTELTKALQTRWERSLQARAAIHPHSPVQLLDHLLAPYRTPGTQPELFRDSPLTGSARRPARQRRQDVPDSQCQNIQAS